MKVTKNTYMEQPPTNISGEHNDEKKKNLFINQQTPPPTPQTKKKLLLKTSLPYLTVLHCALKGCTQLSWHGCASTIYMHTLHVIMPNTPLVQAISVSQNSASCSEAPTPKVHLKCFFNHS